MKICYLESKHFIEKTATLEVLGLKEYVSGWAALPPCAPSLAGLSKNNHSKFKH